MDDLTPEEIVAYGNALSRAKELSEDESLWLMPPPRTPKQVKLLMEANWPMYGVCHFCGCAGHIDQLVDVFGETVVACGECIGKYYNQNQELKEEYK